MATTAVSKRTRRLENINKNIPAQYPDTLGIIPEEISPSTVRARIAAAKNGGYIGSLQHIYKIMMTDSRYAGIVNSIMSSVALCPINISAPKKLTSSSKLAYNIVKEQFECINVSRLIKQLTSPYFMGVTVWANKWEIRPTMHASNDAAWFTGLKTLDPVRLYVGIDPLNENQYQNILVSSVEFPEGKPLGEFQRGSLLWGDDGTVDEGYYHLAGAARRCLGWWLGKQYTRSFWSEHNETYAEPTRIAYVDSNMPIAERKQIEKFLKYLGRNMYGIFPEDVDIELVHSNTTATVGTFKEYIDMANNEMSIALTGEIESSGSGNKFGSNAKAETHLKVRSEVVGTMVEDVNFQLKSIRDFIVEFNVSEGMDPDEKPGIALNLPRPEDKLTLAEFYNTVTTYIPVSLNQIRRDLELSVPEDGEETVGPQDRSKVDEPSGPNTEDTSTEKTPEDREAIGKERQKTGNRAT